MYVNTILVTVISSDIQCAKNMLFGLLYCTCTTRPDGSTAELFKVFDEGRAQLVLVECIPEVGSSRKRMFGTLSSWTAMASLFLWKG